MKNNLVTSPEAMPVINDQSATEALVSAVNTDSSRTIRHGMIVIILGFGGFLVWAGIAPLDEGVPTEGMVSLETKSKVVQHLTGGIVETVLVKEGDFVKKDQVLLTIDAANAKARYEEIRHHYLGLRSDENRLLSEKKGSHQIEFHPDLQMAAKDPNVAAKMRNQQALLSSRKALLNADISQIQDSIRAEQSSIIGNKQLLEHRNAELQLVKQQMSAIKEAVDDGYVPRTQYADLQQRETQLNGDVAQITASINRSVQLVAEYQSRMNSRRQTESKEIEEQLARIRLEVDADEQKVNALKSELGRTEIRSPAAGQVIGLQVQTVGAVIMPGQRLLTIVPESGKLLLDARIPPGLIDRIEVGQPADIRFSAFAHTPQLLVDGRVVSVSTDIISDPTARTDVLKTYFLARVEVTDEGMKTLGSRILKPGMPTQIVIKTGERTFLTYLLSPLLKRFSASLKEE